MQFSPFKPLPFLRRDLKAGLDTERQSSLQFFPYLRVPSRVYFSLSVSVYCEKACSVSRLLCMPSPSIFYLEQYHCRTSWTPFLGVFLHVVPFPSCTRGLTPSPNNHPFIPVQPCAFEAVNPLADLPLRLIGHCFRSFLLRTFAAPRLLFFSPMLPDLASSFFIFY